MEGELEMTIIGNILWFLLGGFLLALGWFIAGLLCCITIIGIPLGVQCFKIAKLALFPFGKEISYDGSGVGSFLANLLWIIFFGWELALGAVTQGILFSITIIGIPFGIQCFKFARLALMPFGARVE